MECINVGQSSFKHLSFYMQKWYISLWLGFSNVFGRLGLLFNQFTGCVDLTSLLGSIQ